MVIDPYWLALGTLLAFGLIVKLWSLLDERRWARQREAAEAAERQAAE